MQSQDRAKKKASRLFDILAEPFFIFSSKERPSHLSPYDRLREGLRGALFGVIAFLFVRTPLLFSVSPLALCLLCACECHVVWVLLGVLTGLWQYSSYPWLYAVSAILAPTLRLVAQRLLTPQSATRPPLSVHFTQWLSRLQALSQQGKAEQADASDDPTPDKLPPLFDEPLHLRVTVAVLCALVPCLGIPMQGEFAFYDLYGAAFYLLATPPITLLLAHALSQSTTEHQTPWRAIGTVGLIIAVAYCARDISFLGLSPILLLTTLLLLFFVRRYGLGAGVIVGALGALAYDVRMIPLFLALTLLYALLHPILSNFSLLPALLTVLIYTLLGGGNSMFWAVAPSVAVGMLCFGIFERMQTMKTSPSQKNKAQNHHQDATLQQLICEQNRNAALCRRLSTIAGAFGSLSEVFHQLGETMAHPCAYEIRHLCDEVYDEYCPECSNREICWSSDYANTGSGIYALSRAIASGKNASAEYLPDALRTRCPHTSSILGDIGYRVSRRALERAHSADTQNIAQSYSAISYLLRDVLREQNAAASDFLYSDERSESVAGYLEEHGIHARLVCVSGERQKTVQIFGISPAALTVPQQQLREDVGRLCGTALSRLRYDGSDDGTLTLHSEPALRVDYVHRSAAAVEKNAPKQGKRAVCGDSLRLFESEDGMFYALLCDGMGSGRNAALTSGSCSVFLERVLRAGVGIQTALRMLNHYLRARTTAPEDECSSTVDLFSLDLYTGQGQFIKSGAAPSLILRDGRLYRLISHTVPIGILQAIDVQAIPFDVRPGDHILLFSDGISDTTLLTEDDYGTDDWLTDFLSNEIPSDDTALSDRLIELAREHGSSDDISIISLRISDQQAKNENKE